MRDYRLSPDRANPAERGEFQLTNIDLEFYTESATSEGFSGVGLSQSNPAFEELTAAWQRYVGCMSVIVDATQRNPLKRKEAKAAALEQAQDNHWNPPPRLPEELGTPQEFRRHWQDGEWEISLGAVTNRRQSIRVRSTGLREHEDSMSENDPDYPLGDGRGQFDAGS